MDLGYMVIGALMFLSGQISMLVFLKVMNEMGGDEE